ncbi:MAG TPA: CRISPR-associated endonuclease Cas2 [Rhodanobacteraceae bacterium]
MLIIVCYDVSTMTRAGQRRLRHVAKVCEGRGQRVQKSVFECQLDLMQFEQLERDLLDIIDIKTDCLRFYRLAEPTKLHVREYGSFHAVDFDSPLII